MIPATIFIYLNTMDSQIIYVGSVVILANLFIFFLINIFSDNKKEEVLPNPLGIDYTNINNQTYQQLISKLNQKKDDVFLINAAWVNALRAEAKRVFIAINQSLDGQNYMEVNNVIKEKENKIRQNDAEINAILDATLTAEEYLKLRREIDILKIEIDSEKTSDNLVSQDPSKEIIIKNVENLANPLKSYIKRFFEYIDKRYIIKYV